MSEGRRFGAPAHFRSRVFWSVIPIFVVFLVTFGVITVRQNRSLVEGEFKKRGGEIASSLAMSAELGVLAEDEELLATPVRSVTGNSDVAYVLIYASDGRVLARGGSEVKSVEAGAGELTPDRMLRMQTDPDAAPELQVEGSRYLDFVTPVYMGEAGAGDEMLLGIGGPAGSSDEPIGFVRLGLTLKPMQRHSVSIVKTWVGIGSLFLALAVAVIFIFSERITKPIKTLTEHAKQIEAGNLGQEIPVRGKDEIGQLAVSFNEMARSLSRNISDKESLLDELQDLNANLEDRIEERTAELNARGEALQRSLDEVEAMARTSRALSATLDLDAVLATVCRHGKQISDSDACGIFEVDAEAGRLVVVANHGLPDDVVQGLESLAPEAQQVLRDRIAEVGEVLQIPDVQSDGQLPIARVVAQSGFRALMLVTLSAEAGKQARGLVALRRHPGAYPDQVANLFSTLASQSKVAIENARLFHQTQGQRVELEEKSAALEAANRHKSEFLANMSHELRTPLNAVIGFSEVLLERMFGELNEKQEDYLKDILASGKHLLSLINDILDLSKIEAGRMELELGQVHLPSMAENSMTLVRERATRRGVTLKQEIDESVETILADERKFKQVLLNLLTNAVKFTGQGGTVTLEIKPEGDGIQVSVTDTGVGISEDDQSQIFEAFLQARGPSHAGKAEGTGLGLTLSRKIVELHGGRIWVESALGEGSTFAFTIPKQDADAASEPPLFREGSA